VCSGVAKRVLHAPPIVFKGSGFYITDSRKGSQATLADKTPAAPSTAETKGESNGSSNGSSSESKPAPATTSSTSD